MNATWELIIAALIVLTLLVAALWFLPPTTKDKS